jgi:glucuronate isomerase
MPHLTRNKEFLTVKNVLSELVFPDDRYFGPDPKQKEAAQRLYERVRNLPLICPHGHVDPGMFADPDYSFGTPVDLLLIPDHYVFRMLYSQGIPLEDLGIPRVDEGPVNQDHRRIWQIFAERFHLFRGTPTSLWLNHELVEVFGIRQKLNGDTAQDIYDQIEARLQASDMRPRRLFEQFNIGTLCTTDAATDTLDHHQTIRASGWQADIRPTFRPDALINITTQNWRAAVDRLSAVSGITVTHYRSFIEALEQRRAYFKEMGAAATDHAALTPCTERLSDGDINCIFERALRGEASAGDAQRFTGHMLIEMARMSAEDGLVMQLHPGSWRDHNPLIAERFGRDKGADIPVATEYTLNLLPLLNEFGNDPRFTLILFTLDETTYTRELAPLAGHYPSVKLGPPWWFHDSWNGMQRFFDQVMETAGLYNTVGFNDDTRAFPSIPARHDVWRRASANWLAGLLVRGMIDAADAEDMITDLAYGLAKRSYKL